MGNKHSTEHFLLLIFFSFIIIATMARYLMKIHRNIKKDQNKTTTKII